MDRRIIVVLIIGFSSIFQVVNAQTKTAPPVFGMLNQYTGEMIYGYEGERIVVITEQRMKYRGVLVGYDGDSLSIRVRYGILPNSMNDSTGSKILTFPAQDIRQVRLSRHKPGLTALHYGFAGCNTYLWSGIGVMMASFAVWTGTVFIIPFGIAASILMHQIIHRQSLKLRYHMIKNNGQWLFLSPQNLPIKKAPSVGDE